MSPKKRKKKAASPWIRDKERKGNLGLEKAERRKHDDLVATRRKKSISGEGKREGDTLA